MSTPLWQFSDTASRLSSWGIPSHDFCTAYAATVIFRHLNRSFYLLTCSTKVIVAPCLCFRAPMQLPKLTYSLHLHLTTFYVRVWDKVISMVTKNSMVTDWHPWCRVASQQIRSRQDRSWFHRQISRPTTSVNPALETRGRTTDAPTVYKMQHSKS